MLQHKLNQTQTPPTYPFTSINAIALFAIFTTPQKMVRVFMATLTNSRFGSSFQKAEKLPGIGLCQQNSADRTKSTPLGGYDNSIRMPPVAFTLSTSPAPWIRRERHGTWGIPAPGGKQKALRRSSGFVWANLARDPQVQKSPAP